MGIGNVCGELDGSFLYYRSHKIGIDEPFNGASVNPNISIVIFCSLGLNFSVVTIPFNDSKRKSQTSAFPSLYRLFQWHGDVVVLPIDTAFDKELFSILWQLFDPITNGGVLLPIFGAVEI